MTHTTTEVYRRETPTNVLETLLRMSSEKKMDLTIEEVRSYLNLTDKAGAGTFETIIPELKFKVLGYKGKAYIKITPRREKLSIRVEKIESTEAMKGGYDATK